MKKLILILAISLLQLIPLCAESQGIIPFPQNVELLQGNFMLTKSTLILPSNNCRLSNYLRNQLQTRTGLKLSVKAACKKNASTIKLTIDPKLNFGTEEYELVITSNQCVIKAKTENGLFYGIQSLLQLVPTYNADNYKIQCQLINDAPRFVWRGMMLDVSRHFFPKAFVLKFIDLLAMHKMNTFHWHLVDDQGWRIEIKKYPKLTELGAWREDNTNKPWNYFQYPCNDKSKKLYGGFYTQNDIREIVKYASERMITIVPEIEMPGHSTALLYAYPETSCTGTPWKKDEAKPWEFSDPVCPGKEKTFEMFENILSEVIDLFPSKYIHVGGDECKKTTWATCPDCQQRMKNENLSHVEELQSYLIKRIEKFLVSKNRKLIGWDEILEGGLAPDAAVMSWRGVAGGIEATRQGHEAVMSPGTHCYFDKVQDVSENEKGSLLTLEKVYSYNPIDVSMTPDQAKLVKGGQANLWTERIQIPEKAEEMILPRMTALSEVLWTPNEKKNYPDFLHRLIPFLDQLEVLKYNYFIQSPLGLANKNLYVDSIEVKLRNIYPEGNIYYTTDGTEPTINSRMYKKPVIVNSDLTFNAITILPSGVKSNVISGNFSKGEFLEAEHVSDLKPGIKFHYFEGITSSVKDINKLKLVQSDVSETIDLPSFHSEFNFAVQYTGYIFIEKDGIYTFFTSSDDGSSLSIGGKVLVDNDFVHGDQEVSGQIALRKGFHKIELNYFQGNYGFRFKVDMQIPDGLKIPLPTNILFHN